MYILEYFCENPRLNSPPHTHTHTHIRVHALYNPLAAIHLYGLAKVVLVLRKQLSAVLSLPPEQQPANFDQFKVNRADLSAMILYGSVSCKEMR